MEICQGCGVSFKHHELVQHRRPKAVYVGWDPVELQEIWAWERCGAGSPLASTTAKKSNVRPSSYVRRQKKAVRKMLRKSWRSSPTKLNTKPYRKRKPPKQLWDKRPRRAYCTGCGVTFTHMHLLHHHRWAEHCGGRWLPAAEREHLDKLRREREALLRRERFFAKLQSEL